MHNETAKLLYEMFPEDEKGDFFSAYVYLKNLKHFVYYMREAAGLPGKKPEEALDPSIEEMLRAVVHRISENSGTRDTSIYHQKILKITDAIQMVTQQKDVCLNTPEKVVPYKQAKDIILKNPDSLAVGECACRATSENPCLEPPMEICIYVGDPFASFMAENTPEFRKISQDEAVEILKSAHEKGFVHCAEFKKDLGKRFFVICNCCQCCCLGVQMWNLMEGQVPFLEPSGYVAGINDSCSGCGNCKDACSFGAIKMDADTDQAKIIFDKCMGCGVCEGVCPDNAISLLREPSKGAPLDLEELLSQQK